MLVKHMKMLPPVYTGELSSASHGGNKWIPLYTHVARVDTNRNRVESAQGMCMVAYSDDFCGGLEVRSCRVSSYTVSHSNTWGWTCTVAGMGSANNSDNVEEAFPFLDEIPLIDDETVDLGELALHGLAAEVIRFANSCSRNGIIGRDRVPRQDERFNIAGLMEAIAAVSKRKIDFVHLEKDSWVDTTLHSIPREVASIPFYNYNSDNPVAVYVCATGEEVPDPDRYYDDDWCEDEYCDSIEGSVRSGSYLYGTRLEDHQKAIINRMADQCPRTEWCCG